MRRTLERESGKMHRPDVFYERFCLRAQKKHFCKNGGSEGETALKMVSVYFYNPNMNDCCTNNSFA